VLKLSSTVNECKPLACGAAADVLLRQGQAVHVDSIKIPCSKRLWPQRLKLHHHKLLSTIAFNSNLRRYSKVWGGHDNIFNFNCHYPGSADSKHIPGPCPLDHFINPSALRANGVRFIAAAELLTAPYARGVAAGAYTRSHLSST